MRPLLLAIAVLITASLHAQAWHASTTVYQIYPRSFQDSDGDGIGDLQGIIDRLDALESLGVETLWISPFFQSPQQDWGYDISGYTDIAAEYGDLPTFKRLVEAAHARDMRIVLDLVMNHSAMLHPWFQASRTGDPAHADTYVWADGRGRKGKRPPTNWKSLGSSGWTYDTLRKQHYWSSFLPFQPDLNYRNPSVKAAMFDVLRYWLRLGVDGFRLDMFNALYEDSLLRDNPFCLRMLPSEENPDGFFQRARYNMNQPESFQFATELRAVLDEFGGDRYLVGEVYGSPERMKQFCSYGGKPGLHSVFLFQTLSTPFKAQDFREMVAGFERDFPDPFLPTYVFSNHDRVRAYTRLGDDPARAKLLALFQLTVRGIPFIYNGDEIGMAQARIPRKLAQDPLVHRYPWLPLWLPRMMGQSLNRDECRTPMHWTDESNGGFCPPQAKPWIAFQPAASGSVAEQAADPHSLWRHCQQLLHLRASQPALHAGDLQLVDSLCNRHDLAYTRSKGEQKLLVLLHMTARPDPRPLIPAARPLFDTHPDATGLDWQPWQGQVLDLSPVR